ncbi:hypothetical protein P378_12255 [Desulforamulus profundi]|uniref:Uncharacterized protein n=1 Tax=Desulforamulus profundi TaxID=1383067 RepID=A0A2C6MFA2_9FIRM|nr:hypothetical protein P378_12255 [Desulforamulus profundi]
MFCHIEIPVKDLARARIFMKNYLAGRSKSRLATTTPNFQVAVFAG